VIVLSDSSPLITLAKIGRLDLLQKLYETVTITPQVYAEVVVGGVRLAGSSEISTAAWIDVRPLQNPTELAVAQRRFGLFVGDVSVIVLSAELESDILLMDDMEARKLARREGLVVLGTIGVLLEAFHRNLLSDLTDA
jgi:predicted nucleic acid-binding protein